MMGGNSVSYKRLAGHDVCCNGTGVSSSPAFLCCPPSPAQEYLHHRRQRRCAASSKQAPAVRFRALTTEMHGHSHTPCPNGYCIHRPQRDELNHRGAAQEPVDHQVHALHWHDRCPCTSRYRGTPGTDHIGKKSDGGSHGNCASGEKLGH